MLIIRVGTRPSPLAIKQVEEISACLPGVRFKVITIETKGDKDKTTPLSEMEGADFFTSKIEEGLISGWIDAAIHSAKDLEDNPPKDTVIAATTASISSHDCLVSKNNLPLGALPKGAVVGTSSLKRKDAVLKFRNDLIVKDIRGDINKRLTLLNSGDYDAIIVAHAALIRLGYENRIAEIIPEDVVQPHPLQGRLVVQVRRDRKDLIDLFGRINEN